MFSPKKEDTSKLFKATVEKMIELDNKMRQILEAGKKEFNFPEPPNIPDRIGIPSAVHKYARENKDKSEAFEKKYGDANTATNMTQNVIISILMPVAGRDAFRPNNESKSVSYHGFVDFDKCRQLAEKIPNEYKLDALKELQHTLHVYTRLYEGKQDAASLLLQQCKSQVDEQVSKLDPEFRLTNVHKW